MIDKDRPELLAVPHTEFIIAGASQFYHAYTNSNHEIDGEIEFKTDKEHGLGRRQFMSFKSGDS